MDPNTYKAPEELLGELGIRQPDDIDIEAIAEHCGAAIRVAHLTGCEARIVGSGDRAIITVRDDAPATRQRFSVGHELGHWMHDRGTVAFACETEKMTGPWASGTDCEARANRYAANLLLPASMFKPLAEGRSLTMDTVDRLATVFKMSRTATAIRLVQYGSFPSLLVCNDIHGRKWFARGVNVPDTVWPLDTPGRNTIAYDLLRGSASREPVDVYADQWLERTLARTYTLREDSVVIGSGLVLSLLWWTNEQPLIEMEEESERRAARRSDGQDFDREEKRQPRWRSR